ncbi:MAG: MoaD/ThiS family protein [Anaerolineales bacterium]|nr:MoaD/ThiS family protein [Anaerolineales bacterium]
MIEIELFGQLAPNLSRRQSLTLARAMTVQEIARQLGLNPDEIGLIVINGVQREMDDPVPADCRLCFFPPVSGG